MSQNPDGGEPKLLPSGDPGSEPASSEITSVPEVVNAFPGTPYSENTLEEAAITWEQQRAQEPPPPTGNNGGGGDHSDEPPGEPEEMHRMSFFEHLEELRKRIFYSLISVVVGMGIAWGYRDQIYYGLSLPLTNILRDLKMDDKLVYTNPTGPFNLYIKLAMIAGVFIASPFIIYQAWKFISPGLYQNEKKYAVPFILFCSVLFISGGAFAYFIAFPAALRFLLEFAHQFRPMVTVDEYLSLAGTVILGLAIIFELPVLILFLSLLRLMTPGFMLRNFRYAFLIIVVIAAAVTPTSDIVNMMIFAAPLLGLYFLGIGLSYLVLRARDRNKKKEDEKED